MCILPVGGGLPSIKKPSCYRNITESSLLELFETGESIIRFRILTPWMFTTFHCTQSDVVFLTLNFVVPSVEIHSEQMCSGEVTPVDSEKNEYKFDQ